MKKYILIKDLWNMFIVPLTEADLVILNGMKKRIFHRDSTHIAIEQLLNDDSFDFFGKELIDLSEFWMKNPDLEYHCLEDKPDFLPFEIYEIIDEKTYNQRYKIFWENYLATDFEINRKRNQKKFVWYPGTAYAGQGWINYVQSNFCFNKKLVLSDINDFTVGNKLIKSKEEAIHKENPAFRNNLYLKHDTFFRDSHRANIPSFFEKKKIDTLIISRHPGFKDPEGVIESKILELGRPNIFIYDSGSNPWDLNDQRRSIELFKDRGYSHQKTVIVPELHHQYSEYLLEE